MINRHGLNKEMVFTFNRIGTFLCGTCFCLSLKNQPGLNCTAVVFFSSHSTLSATNWIGLRKLEELDVSDNCLISLSAAVVHCLKSLRFFNVCRNKLSVFPDPWACPLVRNQIDHYPLPVCFIYWFHRIFLLIKLAYSSCCCPCSLDITV